MQERERDTQRECVCETQRDIGKERERQGERKKERKKERACVRM